MLARTTSEQTKAMQPPPSRRRSARGPAFFVEIVRSEKELSAHASALEDLAAASLEPNIFYEPWMLLPALRAFEVSQPLELMLVYSRGEASGLPRFCGFFPLERQRRWKGMPIHVLRMWRHIHCVLGTPLLRADCAQECWAFFLNWLRTDSRGGMLLELPYVTGDGPFSQLLIEHGNRCGTVSYIVEVFTRALYRPRQTAHEYLCAALSGKRRQELKRLEKRLAECGSLQFRTLQSSDDPSTWIDSFLELEARGWKGKEGTALALQEPDRRFFRAFATEAFRQGRLMMLGLYVNDRPIALKCNLLAGTGSYAFKIAFDEEYARYSPGVLLELFNIEQLHCQPQISWMDSCAIPDHPMINRLWPDRRTIQTVLISTGRWPGDLLVSLLPTLRCVKRKLDPRHAPTSPNPECPKP